MCSSDLSPRGREGPDHKRSRSCSKEILLSSLAAEHGQEGEGRQSHLCLLSGGAEAKGVYAKTSTPLDRESHGVTPCWAWRLTSQAEDEA